MFGFQVFGIQMVTVLLFHNNSYFCTGPAAEARRLLRGHEVHQPIPRSRGASPGRGLALALEAESEGGQAHQGLMPVPLHKMMF